MTWFKSLIMRQNSPLLLIDPQTNEAKEREETSNKFKSHHQHYHLARRSRRQRHSNQDNNHLSNSASAQTRQRRVRILEKEEREKEATSEPEENLLNITTNTLNHHPTAHRLPNLVQAGKLMSSFNQVENICQLDREEEEKPTRKRNKFLRRSEPSKSSTSQKNQSKMMKQTSIGKNNHQPSSKHNNHLLLMGASTCFLLLLLGCLSVSGATTPQQYFEVQPESQYLVENGRDIRLRCLIRNRQGECLWLKNGRAVGVIQRKYQFSRQPEDGDCSLMIRNVSVQQDDAIWQCQVTASDVEQDTLQSREVSLVVLVPPERPQIKNTSQNTQRLILEENKSRLVTCEMRGGNPAPQIEWLLDGKNISKEAQTSSFVAATGSQTAAQASSSQRITQSKLKMSDIKRTMNGKNLTCIGVHQTLNQSTSVELDVQYVPTVSVVQREYSIVEGSPLSISCQVDSNPPPNIVNWRLVSDATSPRQQQASNGAISLPTRPGPVLEFERISRDLNQNIFECLAQNSYGISLPADVKLNVLYAPFLLNTSHSESVMVGSQAQLACVFDGNPEPEVKWHYTDPLSRSASAVQLENSKQQYLNIKNVSYRNEGDYHCEARNQINGVYYGVRSSNIILDVYGEPQFLLKSPVPYKAVQGSKSDLTLTFCSDPPPQKVYWQFGSLRLDVRLSNLNKDAQQAAPSGAGKQQHAINQRFQVQPLQSLQKRDSSFSKQPTCFEATLTLLEPELTDQRDYTLVVQNERGHQSAVARLKVSSPLSPVLMITSAFCTICGLFLISLLAMFLLKRGPRGSPSGGSGHPTNGSLNGVSNGIQNGGQINGGLQREKGEKDLLRVNGVTSPAASQLLQQTRGIVNGSGNGLANGASNPNNSIQQQAMLENGGVVECPKGGVVGSGGLLGSMSDTSSANDQKQLLAGDHHHRSQSSSSHSSTSGATNQCTLDYNHVVCSATNSTTGGRSTTNSTPTPLNHISVEHDVHDLVGSENGTILSAYRVGGGSEHENDRSSLSQRSTSATNQQAQQDQSGALIYANIDYSTTTDSRQHSPSDSSLQSIQIRQHQQQPQQQQQVGNSSSDMKCNLMRSNVGATIAMMNSLAAASRQNATGQQSPNAGVLNGAINQQLAAQTRQIRKPGPPKPPKPSIQQRSRFYQQHAAQLNGSSNGSLVMIGSPTNNQAAYQQQQESEEPTANELAVEYSRLAFPARAEI